MSKYSSRPSVSSASRKAHTPDTHNLAGGRAHSQNAPLELASIVLTSFLKDQFYRTEQETVTRLNALFAQVPPEFIAKLAIFARNEYGMRSVSHYCAAWLGRNVHSEPWLRPFYKAVVRRPDDILEILSCFIATRVTTPMEASLKAGMKTNSGPRLRLPNAMKRGLGDKLTTLSPFALAKYRKDGAELSMIDAVNLCHPKHSEPLAQLINGTLPTADTWETAISAAGQGDDAEVDVAAAKGAEWDRLLNEHKLGYFALLRNIRNICESATNPEAELCRQLVDAEAIKKSLVLPFRFLSAIEVVEQLPPRQRGKLMPALTDAVELAMANVPVLPGRTLVALDDSGSMQQVWKKAVLLAAAIAKANDADLMIFDFTAKYVTVNRRNPVLTIAQGLPYGAGGTNFHSIFRTAYAHKEKYDRIIILSDMQGWIGRDTPAADFKVYQREIGCNPRVYSVDLAGYGTMQFPEDRVFCLAGFSEKIFDTIRLLETDRHALINQINAIEI